MSNTLSENAQKILKYMVDNNTDLIVNGNTAEELLLWYNEFISAVSELRNNYFLDAEYPAKLTSYGLSTAKLLCSEGK